MCRAYPESPDEAKPKFISLYKIIVNELPWTEFVANNASASRVTTHIIGKMKRNIANGIRYMDIHALGDRNVAKVRRILPDVQRETGAIPVKIDQDGRRIFVRLEIPAQLE